MSAASLARSYALAARTTRREAGNFYVAFLTLPREQRRAVYALYTFFRELDNVADAAANGARADVRHSLTEKCDEAALLCGDSSSRAEQSHESTFPKNGADSVDLRRAGIERMRRRLVAAVASAGDGGRSLTEKPGDAGLLSPAEPVCERDLALADAIERFAIEPSDIEDVVRGVEMDLEPVEMQTMDDLERYAYLVASAVGLATLAVLNDGIPPTDEMRGRATRLGLGMQFVNVVRDVGEDAAQGRVYVPRELLAAHGVERGALEHGEPSDGLRNALREVAERARGHLRAGRELIPYVPRRSRACLWLLAEVYGRILTRIERAGYDVFSSRISLPGREKLWLLATARWRA